MSEYLKKWRISKRTATTRLYTDDEREVQRRATNEGKDRSEIIRQAVSNAFRTERLALARKDETMQPVIDTYRKMMEAATGDLRSHLISLQHETERMRSEIRKVIGEFGLLNENLETIACSSRYNTEQTIVIRALMHLYIFHVHEQLTMQCDVDPMMTERELAARMVEFRFEAGNELARIMRDSAADENQDAVEQLIDKLYRNLLRPLDEAEVRASIAPRW
jgi:uncharacterized protein YdiU (UPF0061 family)